MTACKNASAASSVKSSRKKAIKIPHHQKEPGYSPVLLVMKPPLSGALPYGAHTQGNEATHDVQTLCCLVACKLAVHSIMVGLVPKAAVMLAQHGCATAQLKQVYNGKAKDPLESLVQSGPRRRKVPWVLPQNHSENRGPGSTTCCAKRAHIR